MQHNFKLYKKGKYWVFASSIMATVVGGVFLMNTPAVEADTVTTVVGSVSPTSAVAASSANSSTVLNSTGSSATSASSATANISSNASVSSTSANSIGSVAGSTNSVAASASQSDSASNNSSVASSVNSSTAVSSSQVHPAIAMRTMAVVAAPTIVDSGNWSYQKIDNYPDPNSPTSAPMQQVDTFGVPWTLDSNGVLTLGQDANGTVYSGPINMDAVPTQFSVQQNNTSNSGTFVNGVGADVNLVKSIVVAKGANLEIMRDSASTLTPVSASSPFANLPNVTSIDLTGITNNGGWNGTYNLFSNDPKLTNIVIPSGLLTSAVKNVGAMFAGDAALKTIDLSNFDTTNATSMAYMFAGDTNLTNLDLSNFKTANVTDMSAMFNDDPALTKLDLSSFNTANVTEMYDMFAGDTTLNSINLSSFNTSNVKSMAAMFYNTPELANLDLSNFNTANVTSMGSMFNGSSTLTNLDLSNFNTANVTDMSNMFKNTTNLNTLNLTSFDTGNVTSMDSMFQGAAALTDLNLSNFDTGNVTDMVNMFASDSKLATLDVSSFNTANVNSMFGMFYMDPLLKSLDLSKFNTANVTNMAYMFNGDSILNPLDVSSFNTANVTNMQSMFGGDFALKILDLANFDTGNVTNMNDMFGADTSLTNLNVSSFDTAKVTDMSQMFFGNVALPTLNLANFNTSNVTKMASMFAGDESMTNLNVTSFDTSNVTNMVTMFSDLASLQSLDMSSFSSKSLDNGGVYGMLESDPILQVLKLGNQWSFSPSGSGPDGSGTVLENVFKGNMGYLGRFGIAPIISANGTVAMSNLVYLTAPDAENGYYTGLWQEMGSSTDILKPTGQVIAKNALINLPVGSLAGTWVWQHMPVTFFNSSLTTSDSGTFTNFLAPLGDGTNGLSLGALYTSNPLTSALVSKNNYLTTTQANVSVNYFGESDGGYNGVSNLAEVPTTAYQSRSSILTIKPIVNVGNIVEGPDVQTISAAILNSTDPTNTNGLFGMDLNKPLAMDASTGLSRVKVTTNNALPGTYDIWTMYGSTNMPGGYNMFTNNTNMLMGSAHLTVNYTPTATTVLGTAIKTNANTYQIVDTVTATGLPNATYSLVGNLVDLANNLASASTSDTATGVYDASGHATVNLTYKLPLNEYGQLLNEGAQLQSQVTGSSTTINNAGNITKNADGTYSMTDPVTLTGTVGDNFTLTGTMSAAPEGVDLSSVTAKATGTYDANGNGTAQLVYTLTATQYMALAAGQAQLTSTVNGIDTTNNTSWMQSDYMGAFVQSAIAVDPTFTNEEQNLPKIVESGVSSIDQAFQNKDGLFEINDAITLAGGPAGNPFTLTGNLVDLTNSANLSNVISNVTGVFNADGSATAQITYYLTPAQYGRLLQAGDTVESQVSGSDLVNGISIAMDPTYTNESAKAPMVHETGVTKIDNAVRNSDGTYTISDAVTLAGGVASDNFTLNGTLVDLTTASNLVNVTGTTAGIFGADGTATATITYNLTGSQYATLLTAGDTIESQVTGMDTTDGVMIAMDPTYTNESLAIPKISESGVTKINNATRNTDGSYTINDVVTLAGGIAGNDFALNGTLVDLTTPDNLVNVTGTTAGTFSADGSATVTIAYTLTGAQYTTLLTAGDTIESQVAGMDTTNGLTIAMDPTYAGESLAIPKISESGVTKINNAMRNADGSYTINDAVTLTGGIVGDAFALNGTLVDLTAPDNLVNVTGTTAGVFGADGTATATITYTLTGAQYTALLNAGNTIESQVTGRDSTNNLTIAMDPTYTGESLTIPKITESGVTSISNASRNADGSYMINDAVTLVGGLAGDTFVLNGTLVDLTTPGNLSGLTGTATGSFDSNGKATATISYTLTTAQYDALLTAGDTVESQVIGNDSTNNLVIAMDPTYTGESLTLPKISESGVTQINRAVQNADGSYTVDDAVTLTGGQPGDQFVLDGRLVDISIAGNLVNVTALSTGVFGADGTATATLVYHLSAEQYALLATAGDTIESQVTGIDTTNGLTIQMDPTYTGESEAIPKTPIVPAQPKVVTPKAPQVSPAKLPATGTESQAGILELGEAMSLIALLGLLDILRKRKSADEEI
ncbi:BspA family leucine-rich repeat surface protein [Weissella muntiaci]|nr:BspA family leucine-rich repeat surface protein [Weissella muntiaci]